ncbi:MAG: hypothetical protein K2M52_00350 [Paramuribaculum sp.]|nr:hypothetical protein [Paramuribaculum sp.]
MTLNLTIQRFRILVAAISIIAAGTLTSCKDDKETPPIPLEFENSDYTIRSNIATLISFKNGSGKYEVEVSDPRILGAPFVNINDHSVYVCPISTGNSTLTVRDLVTGTENTIGIAVTELYFEFFVSIVREGVPHPGIEVGDELRFIRTSLGKRVLELRRGNAVIQRGKFDIILGKKPLMEFYLWDDPDHDEYSTPDYTYTYLMGGSSSVFILFNKGFDFNWDKIIDCRGSAHAGPMLLRLTDETTKLEIEANAELNLVL